MNLMITHSFNGQMNDGVSENISCQNCKSLLDKLMSREEEGLEEDMNCQLKPLIESNTFC